MIEVTQTITVGDGSGRLGNCLQAAVGSLLELDLDEVPHFAEIDDWEQSMVDFARYHGYRAVATSEPPAYGLAFGRSERGVAHSVVVRNGAMVWDPHPSRSGLVSVSTYVRFDTDSGGVS